jgi:hypothetical protein
MRISPNRTQGTATRATTWGRASTTWGRRVYTTTWGRRPLTTWGRLTSVGQP